MKKKLISSIGLTAIIASSFALGAYAASDIKLFINGKTIDTPVEIIDGSSYVPLRVVSEALGADVKWDGDARTISITGGAQAPVVKANLRSQDVKINVTSGPMKLDITKVTFDPAYKRTEYSKEVKAIVLDAKIENTSDSTVTWYPTHGKIATNTKEQVDSAILHSDDIDGQFIGKVIKTGKIVFEIKGDLDGINGFNYVINGAHDSKTYAEVGADKTIDIVLK